MEKHIISKLLIVVCLVVTSPPILLISWFMDSYPELRSIFNWIALPLGLVWLVGSWWFGGTTAHHMLDEKKTIAEAIKDTLFDMRLNLAFLPLIGSWFTPEEDKRNWEDDES